MTQRNNFPKLHNAAWPGVVGKGPDSDEPFIDLDTMIELTAGAEVDGVKFDGIDLFLCAPHVDIDSSDADLEALAEKVRARNLKIGSFVAPVWPPTGGGSAMGTQEERDRFVDMVRKACVIGQKLEKMGVRDSGIVRIDSAVDPGSWSADPDANTRLIADTFTRACDVAEEHGTRLAMEGEICWGGMQSWKECVKLLKMVDRPKTLGFQADMAHTLLFALGHNDEGARLVPADFDWNDADLKTALTRITDELRPWTIDFHVAQNDATVKGQGSHDKTGRHCMPNDPNGKLDIARDAGYWLKDGSGNPTKATRHICWDGCMFPNDVMMSPQTWNDVLAKMIAVRDAHGWYEPEA